MRHNVLIIHVVLLVFMSPKHRWHLCVFLSRFNALLSNKYLFSPSVIIAFWGLGKLTSAVVWIQISNTTNHMSLDPYALKATAFFQNPLSLCLLLARKQQVFFARPAWKLLLIWLWIKLTLVIQNFILRIYSYENIVFQLHNGLDQRNIVLSWIIVLSSSLAPQSPFSLISSEIFTYFDGGAANSTIHLSSEKGTRSKL